jgi:benzoyl-CoA reductase/2-hydroxyglutaryl-CoA dehydratase subunit BcrC/BadD/HgdB
VYCNQWVTNLRKAELEKKWEEWEEVRVFVLGLRVVGNNPIEVRLL